VAQGDAALWLQHLSVAKYPASVIGNEKYKSDLLKINIGLSCAANNIVSWSILKRLYSKYNA